jgi:hypothetical protein
MKISAIHVGIEADYYQVCERKGFAVWRKTLPGGQVSYLIAKRPALFSPSDPPPPSSVHEEFDDEQVAVAALNRWATDSLPPRPFRKLKRVKQKWKAVNRKRPGPGQMLLEL